jgi:NADH-quinone oxidoreductase subunit J
MTTGPRLKLGSHLIPGLAAVALFVVLAAVFLTTSFGAAQGFADGSITANIGYAMFNIAQGGIPSEGFLVAFEIIDLVLIAAVAAAVMLARREDDGRLVGLEQIRTDGGRPREDDSSTSERSTATDATEGDD